MIAVVQQLDIVLVIPKRDPVTTVDPKLPDPFAALHFLSMKARVRRVLDEPREAVVDCILHGLVLAAKGALELRGRAKGHDYSGS